MNLEVGDSKRASPVDTMVFRVKVRGSSGGLRFQKEPTNIERSREGWVAIARGWDMRRNCLAGKKIPRHDRGNKENGRD